MRVFDGEAVDLSQANAVCRHARGKGQKGPTAMIQEPSQPASLVSTRRRIVGLTMSGWLGPRSVNSGAGGKGFVASAIARHRRPAMRMLLEGPRNSLDGIIETLA